MKKNQSLLTIFIIVFIDLFGFGLILPLLPFIAQKYQASSLVIGFLTAVYSFFQFIFAPVLGRLSDRYGRRRILIVSQFGSMIGYLILGIANNLPLLFLSRIIDGITGGNISVAQAYIADITDKNNRAKGMGLIGAAFGLGFIFGPAIGGLLSKISYSAPAFTASIMSLITISMTFLFLKETVNIKKSIRASKTQFNWQNFQKIIKKSPVNLLIIIFFGVNLAFSSFQGIFALYGEKKFNFGPDENGIIFAYIGILVVLAQILVMPFFVKKFKEKKVMKAGLLIMFLSLFFIPLSKDIYFLIFALTFLPFGNGFFNPTTQTLVSENIEKEEYGETLGLMHASGSLGRILGPIIAGELFSFSINFPFYFSSFIILILLVLIYKK